IMRLFIAREALDRHLAVAGDLVNPKATTGMKLAALPKIAAFYAGWYPTRWLGWGLWPRYGAFGALATHVRFLDRTTRRLSRSIFHLMALNGPKLERRQALLFRAVDIGADLFAMTAAVARAESLRRRNAPEAAAAVELADVFCRTTTRRIEQSFASIRSHDDVKKHATALRLLAGEFAFLEEGLAPPSRVLE
ncbi:MAG: acyl-CoA dehydrogenase, partial [Thermoanaerobaculia bacterium]